MAKKSMIQRELKRQRLVMKFAKKREELKKQIHKNTILQRLFNKYGVNSFVFEIIEILNDPNELLLREQFYLDALSPNVNILKVAGSAFGYKHTEESKNKISRRNTGRKMTQSQIQKGVISRIGQKTSKGCKRTDAAKKHLSELKKKKVINYVTGITFSSIGEAADMSGLKYSTFYAKLSGRNFNNTNCKFL